MRNINIVKIANVVAVFAVFVLILMPLVTLAVTGGTGGFKIPEGGPVAETTATGIITRIIQILLAIAGLVAVIFLIVGGFRYITAGGNEEAAESAKKTIQNSIIGIVIVILAFVIVRVIANALTRGAEGV